jgi:hypothetical protein
MRDNNFVKGVERLVNPIDVGTIHFIQSFNNKIPKKLQRKMVESSAKITPQMAFVVEPYSYFLAYEIENTEMAERLLPKGFRLTETKIFDDDQPKYYGIFGCFNAHTSGFWGMRVELYLIAEDMKTGLMSWIIVDYDTNTITYDPKYGLSDPNASNSIITVDYDGILYADIKNTDGRELVFRSDISQGKMKALDKRLWIEGNLSIAYGKNKVEDDPGLFSLTFNPDEFKQALRISHDNLEIEVNNWYPGLFKDVPSEIVCFPYAQHFLSDSPGYASHLETENDLEMAVENTNFDLIKVFSTEKFKKSFMIGSTVSLIANLVLFSLLILI